MTIQQNSVHLRKYLLIFLTFAALSGCDSSANITAEQHVKKAEVFIDGNDLNAGIIELKNALQKNANLPEARWLLGKTYLMLGNGAGAANEFATAESLGFTHPDLEANKLRAHLLQAEYDTVLNRINSLSESRQNNAEILTLQGDAMLGLGNRVGARSSYLRAQKLDSSSAAPLIGLARVAFVDEKSKQADKYIEESLALEPENVEAWNLKGRSALFKNDAAAAETAFAHAADLAEYNLTAHLGLIRALLAQQKFDAAKESIKKVESRFSRHPITQYFHGYIALQNDDVDKAKSHLQEALRLQPDHPESLFLMSRILFNENHLNQAIQHINPFLTKYPDNLEAIKLKSSLLIKLNQPKEAVALLEQAVVKNPDDASLLALLGTTYVRAGDPDRGIGLLERAISITDGDVAALKTQLAMARLSSGATDLAISDLESAIELEPDFINADILLVLSHMQAGKFEAALNAASNLADKAPDNPMAFNLMGAAYVGMKETDKAREEYNRALKLNPDYIPALSNLANLELTQGNKDLAEQRYLKILEIDEDNTKALVQMARLEAERNNTEKLLDYLQQARKSSTTSVEPRILLGRYYLTKGQSTKLLEVTAEAFKLAPEIPDVLLLHGQALRLNGDMKKSQEILERLVEKVPESANANYQLGLTKLQAGNLEGADISLSKAIEQEPNHAGALNAAAKLALRRNNFAAAREYADRVKAIQPNSAESIVLEGDILLSQNNPQAAVIEYEKAMVLTDSGQLLTKLASAYEQSGQKEKAILAIDKWLNKNPEDVQVNLLLAKTYQNANQETEAIKVYKKILSDQDPDNVIALNNLAWLSIQEDPGYAYELANKANNLVPDQPEILDTLGWILVQQGELERGLVHLRAANSIFPESPHIRFHIASALAKSGDKEQALDELASLLKTNIEFSDRKEAERLYNSLK